MAATVIVMINNFFKDLATRISKENGLSDITWAMANNCEEFLIAFMELFSFEFDRKTPYDIYREYSLDNRCRPDFVVKNRDKMFIIENKIYDTNYHFKEYAESPKGQRGARLGIIVNHKLDDNSRKEAYEYKFTIKTWEDFIKLLSGKEFSPDVNDCVKAYINYVKEVCSIMEFKEIRFDKLNSLFYFNNLVKKVIDIFHHEDLECGIYSAPQRAFGISWSGQYFSFKRKGSENTVWPFFGICFEEDPPYICISVEKDWNKDIYLKLKDKREVKDLYKVEAYNEEIDFILSEDRFDEFKKASLEKQEEILVDFFKSVLDDVSQYLA